MPSSKFNQRPVPKKRPAICIAPAGSCLPGYDLDNPPYLQGYVRWIDLDPLRPVTASGYAFLSKTGPQPTYYGESALAGTRIAAEVWPTGPPGRWNVDVILFWESDPPETVHFTNVYVDPTKPFDSDALEVVTIPGQDFQQARIMN